MSDQLPGQFSDEHARAILARAIEIDARTPMMTTEDLRAIAAEIGVSRESLDAALREQIESTRARPISTGQRTSTILTGLGLPLGVAAGLLVSSGGWALPALSIMVAGLVTSGGLVIFQSSTGSLRSFHLKNFAFWSGLFVGGVGTLEIFGSRVGVAPSLIMAGWCLRGWISSSILGSAGVVAVRRSRQSAGSDTDTGTPEAP